VNLSKKKLGRKGIKKKKRTHKKKDSNSKKNIGRLQGTKEYFGVSSFNC
jgi:hypothetical protein